MNDEEGIVERMERECFERAISRKESALKLLEPLGFVDADDAEYPGAIWHRGCALTLDAGRLSPADFMQAILEIGRERGRTDVRNQMRDALGL